MTRIVGGTLGGRTLEVPARGTRPTSDRVREALFSTLDALMDLAGARVLDLFAGSGAVGLESASRGAAQITLVDSDREVAKVLRRNVAQLGLSAVEVRVTPVEEFLTGIDRVDRVEQDGRVDSGFDLVFVDPPYRYPEAALASVLEQLTHPHRWLADGAVIVVERAGKSGPPQWPSLIRPIKDKRYGDTVLWYASTG